MSARRPEPPCTCDLCRHLNAERVFARGWLYRVFVLGLLGGTLIGVSIPQLLERFTS